MSWFDPTSPALGWAAVADAGFFLFAGAALGALYFLMLREAARLLAAGGGALRAAPLHAARFAVAGTGFWLAAQNGAAALLATLAGFVLARVVVMRLTRER